MTKRMHKHLIKFMLKAVFVGVAFSIGAATPNQNNIDLRRKLNDSIAYAAVGTIEVDRTVVPKSHVTISNEFGSSKGLNWTESVDASESGKFVFIIWKPQSGGNNIYQKDLAHYETYFVIDNCFYMEFESGVFTEIKLDWFLANVMSCK